jgi:hypothetical protein
MTSHGAKAPCHCLEAVLQPRDSKIDQLQSSRWRAYHNGLATVRAQLIATTCTAIRSLAIDGTEDRDLQQHTRHLPDNLQPHTSLRSSAHHNDHSPRPHMFSSAFFARGQKTKHRITYTSRSNTLLPILLFLLFIVNLVFATDFFFLLDIQMLSLIAVPLLSRFLYEGGGRSWRIRGRGFCTILFCWGKGVDFAGDETCHF